MNLPISQGHGRDLSKISAIDLRAAQFPALSSMCNLLIKDGTDSLVSIHGRDVTLGLGFGVKGTPIDVATLLLSSAHSSRMVVLVVDEFQRMNGMPESCVVSRANETVQLTRKISSVYKLPIKTVLASELMMTESYRSLLSDLKEEILNHPESVRIAQMLRETVPISKRNIDPSGSYTLHEIAISKLIGRLEQVDVKLGPEREKLYDIIMKKLGLPFQFTYVVDALTVCTNKSESVVHYIPTHRGTNNGQRVYFEDSERVIRTKLSSMSSEATEYFLKLALSAKERITGACCFVEYQRLRELPNGRKVTTDLVIDFLIKPLL